MAYNFKECNYDQVYLLPPNIKEWIPEGDLVLFVMDVVAQMDLAAFYRKYRPDGRGQSAFEPSMMTTLLLYSYSVGVRSSRQIERLCERDIGFKVLTANQAPDHCTIARFRKENGEALKALFTDVLKLCAKAGLVKVGVVALDGSKIKANAALGANRSHEHIEKEVRKMLADAERVDAEEDRLYGKDKRGDELPDDLRDRKSRLKRLQECKKRLEAEAAEKAQKQQEKIDERTAEEAETGQKKRGRKPQEPDSTSKLETKANPTDPDSRIMKTRKGYVQGYNGQVVVTEKQIIVAAELTVEENDINQLHPMMEKAQENIVALKLRNQTIKIALADAGYCSEKNLKQIDPKGPEHLIATQKDWKQRKDLAEAPPPRGRIPNDLTEREQMERKLRTTRGKKLYKKRSQVVEPVFGQIKDARGITTFLRRGYEACAAEWKLICTTHNLLKLWRSGKAMGS
jgi:transposase